MSEHIEAADAAKAPKRAWRYDFTTYAVKNPDGTEKSPERTSTEIVYQYNTDEVDYGNYWDYGKNGGCFEPYTDDGVFVTFGDDICDRWRGLENVETKLLEEMREIGDYAECELKTANRDFDKVRITLIAPPHISAAESIKQSDRLNKVQMMRIRINGKPLLEEGSIVSNDNGMNSVLLPNDGGVEGVVSRIIREYLLNRIGFGDFAIKWHWNDFSADYESFTFDISADSRNALVHALRVIGVKNPEEVGIGYVAGDAEGEKRVFATINFTQCYS